MNADLPSETPPSPEPGMLDVLIVEDSPVIAQRLAELVGELAGTRVVGVAATEALARDLIRKHHPHVLVLDLHLRQGTGFGVLRALGPTGRPTVIVLSSYSVPEYRARARELGVDHFLDKAAEFHQLPILLRGLLQGPRPGLS